MVFDFNKNSINEDMQSLAQIANYYALNGEYKTLQRFLQEYPGVEKFIENYVPDWVYGKFNKPKTCNVVNNIEVSNSNNTENNAWVDNEIVKDDSENNTHTNKTNYPSIYTKIEKGSKSINSKTKLIIFCSVTIP